MSADRKLNFTRPEFPKGGQAIAKVIELVNTATFRLNPSFESDADSLVTKPSQVHVVSPAELRSRRVNSFEERIIFRLFQKLGIPEETLQPIYLPPNKIRPIYCEPTKPEPQLYLEDSLRDGFDAENSSKRVLTALKLGGLLIQTNFNLLVKPADVSDDLRKEAKSTLRRHLYGSLLMNMASIFGDQVDSLAFETIGGIVSSLESRVAVNGGLLCLLLPHQTAQTAEVTVGGDLHSALILYHAKQTIEEFMKRISGEGFTPGLRIVLPPEVTAADLTVRSRFDRLKDPKLDKTFAAFRKSQLPLTLIAN